jgi:hypothetical protein
VLGCKLPDCDGTGRPDFSGLNVREQSPQPALIESADFDQMIHQITIAGPEAGAELVSYRLNLRQR